MITVKNLEWRKGRAETPFGPYHVIEETNDDEPFWFVMFNGKAVARCGTHDDEESAVFAAQADYERRTLSAIEAASPLSKLKAGNARMEAQLAEARKALEQAEQQLDYGQVNAAHRILIRALSSPDHADAGKVEGDGWRPIESAPTNRAIQIFIPNADYYGNDGVYAGILVDLGTGQRWATFGWAVARDLPPHMHPSHWRPLSSAPSEGAE